MAAIADSQGDVRELDGDVTRRKVLFEDGVLLDCVSGATRMAAPSDRMGHRAACPYAVWQPSEHVPLLELLREFYMGQGTTFEDSEIGQK
eukprot:2602268-Alexandrium_andersonii.AAC.1